MNKKEIIILIIVVIALTMFILWKEDVFTKKKATEKEEGSDEMPNQSIKQYDGSGLVASRKGDNPNSSISSFNTMARETKNPIPELTASLPGTVDYKI